MHWIKNPFNTYSKIVFDVAVILASWSTLTVSVCLCEKEVASGVLAGGHSASWHCNVCNILIPKPPDHDKQGDRFVMNSVVAQTINVVQTYERDEQKGTVNMLNLKLLYVFLYVGS